jgi:hypothetical protein
LIFLLPKQKEDFEILPPSLCNILAAQPVNANNLKSVQLNANFSPLLYMIGSLAFSSE